MSSEVMARKTIYDLWQIKTDALSACERMNKEYKLMDDLLESIGSHVFYHLNYQGGSHGEDYIEKALDQRIWQYMIKIYNLEKYMLCTEYEKLQKQIYDFNFPVFTIKNAEGWLTGLKAVVHESVQKLIEDVFERITKDTYWTGSGYSNHKKKKRNNNGIDKHFIITTNDHHHLGWYSVRPTITDDLEKACYIIDGKELPEITIKTSVKKDGIWEAENAYFRVRFCKNGNTHYWLKDQIRERLNFYGAKRGVIGNSIRIKVFEDKW